MGRTRQGNRPPDLSFAVESALSSHPAVAEAGVVGLPDATVGEIVHTFVVLKPGFEPGETLRLNVLAHARSLLGPAVVPKAIDFRAVLPKTPSGKILRRVLKARELGLEEGGRSRQGCRPPDRAFEVESTLTSHRVVVEAGVVSLQDAMVGAVVHGFVVLKLGFEPSEALRMDILAYARSRYEPPVAPKAIAFRAVLPKTPSGKILRRVLKARELGLEEGGRGGPSR